MNLDQASAALRKLDAMRLQIYAELLREHGIVAAELLGLDAEYASVIQRLDPGQIAEFTETAVNLFPLRRGASIKIALDAAAESTSTTSLLMSVRARLSSAE